jgi:hypothetical protein
MRAFVGYGGPVAEAIARRLHTFLQENKIEAFLAPDDNPAGEWDPNVQDALWHADVFVVVCSPQSFRSKELFKEILLATEWEIPFQTYADERTNKNGKHFPKRLNDFDIIRYKPRDQDAMFPEVLRKLNGLFARLPYRMIEPVEVVAGR